MLNWEAYEEQFAAYYRGWEPPTGESRFVVVREHGQRGRTPYVRWGVWGKQQAETVEAENLPDVVIVEHRTKDTREAFFTRARAAYEKKARESK